MGTSSASASVGYSGKYASTVDPSTKFQRFQVFDHEECDTIVEGVKRNLQNSNDLLERFHGAKENSGEMDLWVLPKKESALKWVYDRITPLIKTANKVWNFNVQNYEDLHMTKFGVTNNCKWKIDNFEKNVLRRKLSFTVLLSGPEEYREGDIELWFGEERIAIPRPKKGEMIIYPAFLLNRITSVKRGPRFALTSWVNGRESFK